MPEPLPEQLIHTSWGRLVAGFSGRRGGRSVGRFAAANISSSVGDDPAAVAANRALLGSWLGVGVGVGPLVTSRQRHTAHVVRVTAADVAAAPTGRLDVVADGLLTTERDVVLLVGTADCVPVVLGDADRAVAGVLHVGWRGLVAGIVEAGVAALGSAGARIGSIIATVGPAIGPCCYPVDDDVRTLVTGRFAAAAAISRSGRPALDLPAAVMQALAAMGVDDVRRVGGCTAHHPDAWFSSRRDGSPSGCQGALAMVRGD